MESYRLLLEDIVRAIQSIPKPIIFIGLGALSIGWFAAWNHLSKDYDKKLHQEVFYLADVDSNGDLSFTEKVNLLKRAGYAGPFTNSFVEKKRLSSADIARISDSYTRKENMETIEKRLEQAKEFNEQFKRGKLIFCSRY